MAHIKEFYEYVNLTADELDKWLQTKESKDAGYSADGGETTGHESGREIVEILKKNPKPAEEDSYDEEELSRMGKVVAYCKRHLAQEEAGNDEKSPEELKKTKSYRSLKNWGYDALKVREDNSDNNKKRKETDDKEPETSNKARKTEEEQTPAKSQKTPAKTERTTRSASKKTPDSSTSQQKQSNSETPTKKTPPAKKQNTKSKADKEDGEESTKSDAKAENKTAEKSSAKSNTQDKSAAEDQGDEAADVPSKGDEVSWNYGGGNPTGKVLDVKETDASIETKNGNEVKRKGTAEDPAVILDAGKSKAIKLNHELN